MLELALPANAGAAEADRRAFVRRQMTTLAVALKRHRLERGEYPDGLNMLPGGTDRQQKAAAVLHPGTLVYRREGEGFVLTTETPTPTDADPEASPPFELVIRVAR